MRNPLSLAGLAQVIIERYGAKIISNNLKRSNFTALAAWTKTVVMKFPDESDLDYAKLVSIRLVQLLEDETFVTKNKKIVKEIIKEFQEIAVKKDDSLQEFFGNKFDKLKFEESLSEADWIMDKMTGEEFEWAMKNCLDNNPEDAF